MKKFGPRQQTAVFRGRRSLLFFRLSVGGGREALKLAALLYRRRSKPLSSFAARVCRSDGFVNYRARTPVGCPGRGHCGKSALIGSTYSPLPPEGSMSPMT